MTKNMMAVVAMLGLTVGVTGGVHAQTNFITNGSFETITNGSGQMGQSTNATGWTTNGYNFIFTSGSADTTGSGSSHLKLWGPGTGSANGLPASSPDGGNFIGADGAYQVGAINQTVTGLTVGHVYQLSFNWGAAQQSGFNGATTDKWDVSLGSEKYATVIDSIASHGFSGWQTQTFNYTATANSEVLSFLATGTPTGVPPFALLDGVKMYDISAVPEPSALASLFVGGLGLAAIIRRRALAKKSKA